MFTLTDDAQRVRRRKPNKTQITVGLPIQTCQLGIAPPFADLMVLCAGLRQPFRLLENALILAKAKVKVNERPAIPEYEL